jgi:pyruvate,water dikinase
VRPGGLKALEPNAALRQIASAHVPRDEVTIGLLLSGDDQAIRAALGGSARGQALLAAVDGFLQRFGFLSANGTDFTEPPWDERPGTIWSALGRLGWDGPSGVVREDGAAVREQARRAVADRCGRVSRTVMNALLDSAGRYVVLRERVSVQMTKDAYRLRQLFRALGDRLVADGRLRDRDEVFLLYYDELRALVAGDGNPTAVAASIDRRRGELEADAKSWPPETVCGEAVDPPSPPVAGASEVLVGIPGSAGHASGLARIVLDPAAVTGPLGPEDVLVVPFSDVGWTPLFATVGAVVAEVGGQLSHTAIVAREYGLPAVVGVRGATRLIAERQPITVDGSRGRVSLGRPDRPESV